jgi:NAD(P)-dependent dehydrogenase (short-subunit alcohol dehydrogenase family)
VAPAQTSIPTVPQLTPAEAREAYPGLDGRTVAVTGGASGIGRAVGRLVAQAGGTVVSGDANASAVDELQAEADRAGLPVTSVLLDVTDPASVEAFVAVAATQGAPLHGLVCSAGISPDASFLDMPHDLWDRVIDVNLTGTFRVAQRVARELVAGGNGGSIVTLGSANGTTGAIDLAHYSSTKAGVLALTKTMARELGAHGIRVNCASPGGGINTPLFWSRTTPERMRQRVAGLPLPRLGEPEDLAACIAFLLSDLSPWITGQNFHVNGGSLMY